METQISKHANAPIRVLIVDDHVILRQGICMLLNEEGDFEVKGVHWYRNRFQISNSS